MTVKSTSFTVRRKELPSVFVTSHWCHCGLIVYLTSLSFVFLVQEIEAVIAHACAEDLPCAPPQVLPTFCHVLWALRRCRSHQKLSLPCGSRWSSAEGWVAGRQLLADQRKGEECWLGQCQAPSLQGHCGTVWCPGCQSRGKALDTSTPTASCYQSHQEHSAVKYWMEQSFTFTEKRWDKVSFQQWVWVPPGCQVSLGGGYRATGLCGLLCATVEGTCSLSKDRSNSVAGQVPCDTHTF